MGKIDVLITGGISVDVIFPPISKMPEPGEELYCEDFEFTCGAAYNTAVALSRLGMDVAIAAPLGNDFLSAFILDKLKGENVSTEYIKHLDQPLRTLSVAINHCGDRSFLSYEDKLDSFNREKYMNDIVQTVDAKALHISAEKNAASTIRIAKERGMKVFLDVGWDEQWLKEEQLKDIIKLSDYFTPNVKEALVITEESNETEALKVLNKLNGKNGVVIKLGKEGALLKIGNQVTNITGSKRTPLDTTGAGDVFVAGLIAGVLKEFEMEKAIKLGNYCGGCSVERLGGTTGSPRWEDIPEGIL